jgi:DNA-directed RNA polymerase specialized sigma24 family protein
MIESLLEDLPQNGGCEEQEVNRAPDTAAVKSEDSFLAALPVVNRIVSRRRSLLDVASRSDLVQEVALRIWQWRRKHREKSEHMSGDDWGSFAARTAYNEINRHRSRESKQATLPLETASGIEEASVEGQTEIEVFSLIHQVWQEICQMSLRQRRSLLLHSQELIIYFLQSGITEKELARVLGFTDADWINVRDRLPMTDAEIAEEIEGTDRRIRSTATARSIKKARYEARVKLEGSIRK